jgi:hypothetical protein
MDLTVIFFLGLGVVFGAIAFWARAKVRKGERLMLDPSADVTPNTH